MDVVLIIPQLPRDPSMRDVRSRKPALRLNTNVVLTVSRLPRVPRTRDVQSRCATKACSDAVRIRSLWPRVMTIRDVQWLKRNLRDAKSPNLDAVQMEKRRLRELRVRDARMTSPQQTPQRLNRLTKPKRIRKKTRLRRDALSQRLDAVQMESPRLLAKTSTDATSLMRRTARSPSLDAARIIKRPLLERTKRAVPPVTRTSLGVAQMARRLLMGRTAKVVAWTHALDVAPTTFWQLEVPSWRDVDANTRPMDAVRIIRRRPRDRTITDVDVSSANMDAAWTRRQKQEVLSMRDAHVKLPSLVAVQMESQFQLRPTTTDAIVRTVSSSAAEMVSLMPRVPIMRDALVLKASMDAVLMELRRRRETTLKDVKISPRYRKRLAVSRRILDHARTTRLRASSMRSMEHVRVSGTEAVTVILTDSRASMSAKLLAKLQLEKVRIIILFYWF